MVLVVVVVVYGLKTPGTVHSLDSVVVVGSVVVALQNIAAEFVGVEMENLPVAGFYLNLV